jgi:hypothetical protein
MNDTDGNKGITPSMFDLAYNGSARAQRWRCA